MTITWLGHSCFLLESGGFRVLVDPFQGVPGLPDTEARANTVYCSHGHFDHNHTQNVTLTEGGEDPFAVTEVPSSHDGQGGTLRGPNTIRRFAAEGLSVVHLGDLGCQLTAEQVRALRPCDALLVPVGGQGGGGGPLPTGDRAHALPDGDFRPEGDRHCGALPGPVFQRAGAAL